MLEFYGSTFLEPVSEVIKLDLDKLNFLACQLFAIVFGRIFCYLFKPQRFSATCRHLIELSLGIGMTIFCFGIEIWILLLQLTVVYLIITFVPGKSGRMFAFVFTMAYLSFAHIYRMYTDYQGHHLDISGPLMIQTQKLSALAYNLFDGQRLNQGEALRSARHVKHAIRRRVNVLEYLSYCFSFHNIMVGPFTFMADYLRFIEGREEEHIKFAVEAQTDVLPDKGSATGRVSIGKAFPPAPIPPVPLVTPCSVVEAVMTTTGVHPSQTVKESESPPEGRNNDVISALPYSKDQLSLEKQKEMKESIQKFVDNRSSIMAAWWALLRSILRCLVYGFFMTVLIPLFPLSYICSKEYYAHNFLIRHAYLTIICFFMRTKYYLAWELGRAANLSAGYGFDGWTTTGKPSYKIVKNFSFLGIECGTSMKAMLDSWNIGTTQWLREIVYDRMPKKYATWLTFLASAFWHGFYPGYYLCFMSAAFFTIVGRVCRRYLRPLFVNAGKFVKLSYDVITYMGGMYVLNYSCVTFAMLGFTEGLQVWRSLYFAGHIGAAILYFGCPLLGKLKRDTVKPKAE